MELSEQQKTDIRALLSTKNGVLKRNIGYVGLSLHSLLNGDKTSPSHIASDFPKTFYLIVDVLGLELHEHGDKDTYLKNNSNHYEISVNNPPITFIELLIACEIKTRNITTKTFIKYIHRELSNAIRQLQQIPSSSEEKEVINFLARRIELTIDMLVNGKLNPQNYSFPNGTLGIDLDNNTDFCMELAEITKKLAMVEQHIIEQSVTH